MSQPKTARFLIIQALAMHGPLTSTELHEKIPSLTLKQIKDNVTAAKAPGYIKSQLDVTQGAAVHQLTPDGKRWWKANQATPEKSTTSSTATTDKPGVSATTPEASVHGSLPLPAVADARPENAPVEAVGAADTGGDGYDAHTAQEMIDRMGKCLDAIGHMAAPYMKEGELIEKGVATMEMLIQAEGDYIEKQDQIIEDKENLIKVLKAKLATYETLRAAITPERLPGEAHGLYIIADGWQIVEGLEAANEAAIGKALISASGRVVIARPVQVAEVAVQIKEFPQCAAATAPLSN